VPYLNEYFAADADIWMSVGAVGEEIEGRGYGPIGAVLEGDNAVGTMLGLDGGEDVAYLGLRAEGQAREGLEGGLDVVLDDVV